MDKIIIAGTDEAGRGPLAGPVVAAAVILTLSQRKILLDNGLRDSKKLTENKREKLFKLICDIGVIWRAQSASNKFIDNTNILIASLWAMKSSVARLKVVPDLVLVDGNTKIRNLNIPQKTIIKGDDKVLVISAASIIAKVLRDRIMTVYDRIYPEYKFAQHKGYPSKLHKELIQKYGPSPIHRLSFRGVMQK